MSKLCQNNFISHVTRA